MHKKPVNLSSLSLPSFLVSFLWTQNSPFLNTLSPRILSLLSSSSSSSRQISLSLSVIGVKFAGAISVAWDGGDSRRFLAPRASRRQCRPTSSVANLMRNSVRRSSSSSPHSAGDTCNREMEVEKRRSKGGFLPFFDWNNKARKKLFSNSPGIPVPDGVKHGTDDAEILAKSRFQMNATEENGVSSSRSGRSEWNCAASKTSNEGCENRATGVVWLD